MERGRQGWRGGYWLAFRALWRHATSSARRGQGRRSPPPRPSCTRTPWSRARVRPSSGGRGCRPRPRRRRAGRVSRHSRRGRVLGLWAISGQSWASLGGLLGDLWLLRGHVGAAVCQQVRNLKHTEKTERIWPSGRGATLEGSWAAMSCHRPEKARTLKSFRHLKKIVNAYLRVPLLLGPLRGFLGAFWRARGSSWGGGLELSIRVPLLGSSWGPLGVLLGRLRLSWDPFGQYWVPLGGLLGCLGTNLGASGLSFFFAQRDDGASQMPLA